VLDGAVTSNAASYYLTFTPWEERTGRPGLSQDEILKNLTTQFEQIREATIFAFAPPAIEGLGVSGGFQMQLEDRADAGRE
jgi:HAE1 family hydrophobic/amphiphilic exporter-1